MNVAGLLVSVRSAIEASRAVAGGAKVIDVKEPSRGPLGMADRDVWRAVRAEVPIEVPVSIALGELIEWRDRDRPDSEAFQGIAFRKLGLANAGPFWAKEWESLRKHWGPGPDWVAVVYADWKYARTPHPDEVRDVALAIPECAGILVDTWNKAQQSALDQSWASWIEHVRDRGRLVALAGGLDGAAIRRLASLRPDLFAVRGAACDGGSREGLVTRARVLELARAVRE